MLLETIASASIGLSGYVPPTCEDYLRPETCNFEVEKTDSGYWSADQGLVIQIDESNETITVEAL